MRSEAGRFDTDIYRAEEWRNGLGYNAGSQYLPKRKMGQEE